MTDIVERLRKRQASALGLTELVSRMCGDAADEIERLRAALDLERRRLAVSEDALRRALEPKP